MNTKPFRDLTKDEATALAKICIRGAQSEEEIRQRLSDKGFDVGNLAIVSARSGPWFEATIMVRGPRGEIILA